MVQKLFSLVDETSVPDNQDALQNQEVLLPGHLIAIYLKVGYKFKTLVIKIGFVLSGFEYSLSQGNSLLCGRGSGFFIVISIVVQSLFLVLAVPVSFFLLLGGSFMVTVVKFFILLSLLGSFCFKLFGWEIFSFLLFKVHFPLTGWWPESEFCFLFSFLCNHYVLGFEPYGSMVLLSYVILNSIYCCCFGFQEKLQDWLRRAKQLLEDEINNKSKSFEFCSCMFKHSYFIFIHVLASCCSQLYMLLNFVWMSLSP